MRLQTQGLQVLRAQTQDLRPLKALYHLRLLVLDFGATGQFSVVDSDWSANLGAVQKGAGLPRRVLRGPEEPRGDSGATLLLWERVLLDVPVSPGQSAFARSSQRLDIFVHSLRERIYASQKGTLDQSLSDP